jgi:hypothetical protein
MRVFYPATNPEPQLPPKSKAEQGLKATSPVQKPSDSTFAPHAVAGFEVQQATISWPNQEKKLDVVLIHDEYGGKYVAVGKEHPIETLSALEGQEIVITTVDGDVIHPDNVLLILTRDEDSLAGGWVKDNGEDKYEWGSETIGTVFDY